MRQFAQLALGVAMVSANAPAKSEQVIIMGAGMQTCAVFRAHYKGHVPSLENFYFSWAQGYMSGLNVAASGVNVAASRGAVTADLNAIPAPTQLRFIREFCDHNPLERYSAAVEALLAKIRNSKSGLKTW
jgi:hypothetical protein